MFGQPSLADGKTSLPFQVETDQAALSVNAASQRTIRFLWTALGFAVLLLVGLSASALQPQAPQTSSASWHAFSPLPGIRRAGHAGIGQASPTVPLREFLPGSRPASFPVMQTAEQPLEAKVDSAPAPVKGPLTKFRSDADFDYFRRTDELTVELTKPLGAVLEDIAGEGGVKAIDIMEGGSAFETKLLKKNDRLLNILGTDVSSASFDEVMDILIAAPEALTLTVARNVVIRKKIEKAMLTIEGGVSGEVEKDQLLRNLILDSGSELYRGMNKMTNCGGAGQCNSCQVEVLEGMENLSPPTDAEAKMLRKKPDNYRLACQCVVDGDLTIVVPEK